MSDEKNAGTDRLEIDNMYLCGSSLTRVDLSNSNIRDAAFQDVKFEDINLSRTVIENANLTGVSMHDVNLTDLKIDYANLQGVTITRANITGMTIDGILVSDLISAWDATQK